MVMYPLPSIFKYVILFWYGLYSAQPSYHDSLQVVFATSFLCRTVDCNTHVDYMTGNVLIFFGVYCQTV